MRDTRDVRATGLQGDASPEIIEILDDDTNAFGNRASTLTSQDNGGPRWVGPVAAAALVGLIGYGVATSASTNSLPRSAPVTSSTIATTSTVPATSTTIPAPPVPYYAADLPREFSVQAADMQLQGDGGYFSSGDFALFATEGASAGSGRWFSISSFPGGQQSIYATDAYRVLTDRGSVAISHLPSGQSTAQFSPDRSTAVTLTALGWGDEDLVRLAESIVIGRSGALRFSDSALVSDHRLLSSVDPWTALQGFPVEQVYYTTADSPTGGIGILVSQRPSAREGGATLDRQVALRFFLDNATSFEVDGHVAVAGSALGIPGYVMATWIAGDHIVTVSGTMSVPQLIAMARTVHPVSADEWHGMQFQAANNGGNNNFGDYEETQPAPVSFGTDAEAESWIIRAGIGSFANQEHVSWQWNDNGFGSDVDSTAKISTVVDSRRTYVLADLPRAVAAKAELHIARAGLDLVVTPFNDIDPSLDRTFAAYAFSEPVQYTAQIVAPDGTVLAAWPST
jgi:hypothetical protein